MTDTGTKKNLLQNLSYVAAISVSIFIAINFGQNQGEKISATEIKRLEKELDFYKSAKNLNLDSLIFSLDTLSDELLQILNDNKLLLKYKKENENFIFKNKKLVSRIDSLTNLSKGIKGQNEALEKELSDLQIDFIRSNSEIKSYRVEPGESVNLIPNVLTLGLKYVWDSDIDFYLNNKAEKMYIGNQTTKEIGGLKYILTLKKTVNSDNDEYCLVDFSIIRK